ncbi:hypothetical protein VCV18_010735 [Metarhizium anisopliae]
MGKGAKLPNAKPNTSLKGNATNTGLEALHSKRDSCHKAKNPDITEIKKNNRAIRDMEKKASRNVKLKRSSKKAIILAIKGLNKASNAKGKAPK